jgi:hypothetical protein
MTTASNTSELVAFCLLIDCDGAAPYIASSEETDAPQLYDADYDALIEAAEYQRELGVKCRVIPILRRANREQELAGGPRGAPVRGAPSTMWGSSFVPGVKCRGA